MVRTHRTLLIVAALEGISPSLCTFVDSWSPEKILDDRFAQQHWVQWIIAIRVASPTQPSESQEHCSVELDSTYKCACCHLSIFSIKTKANLVVAHLRFEKSTISEAFMPFGTHNADRISENIGRPFCSTTLGSVDNGC